MVYGVLRFINFAHSDVFMVGAFAGLFCARFFGEASLVTGILTLLASMAACALLGVLIERLAYKPLRGRSKLSVLITAIGVSLFLENLGQRVFGAAPKAFPNLFPNKILHFGGLSVSSTQIIILVITVVLLGGLQWIVYRSRMGTAMRAVSFNPQAAALVGININVIVSFTFALGSALAAAGGVLYAINYQSVDPLMGVLPGLKAFVAAVLGGIGNIPGAALGGLIIGLVETFVNGSRWSTYTDAIAFAILIVMLLVRPSGLLGKNEVEKV
jgi:branched-chain amino acid transport system permease protein